MDDDELDAILGEPKPPTTLDDLYGKLVDIDDGISEANGHLNAIKILLVAAIAAVFIYIWLS